MIFTFMSYLHTSLLALDRLAMGLHRQPLFVLLTGLIGGVLIGTTTALSPALIALILFAAAGVWWPWPYRHLQGCCRLLLAGIVLTHLALTYQQRALPLNHIAHHLPNLARQRIQIEGVIDRPVDTRRDRQYVFLRLQRFEQHGAHDWHAVAGRVRLKIHATDIALLPGDRIAVEQLRLHPVRNFYNPGHFDFRAFMHRQGIYAVGGVSRPERVHLLARPPGQRWDRTFAQWRQRMQRLYPSQPPAPGRRRLGRHRLGPTRRLDAGHRGRLPSHRPRPSACGLRPPRGICRAGEFHRSPHRVPVSAQLGAPLVAPRLAAHAHRRACISDTAAPL